MQAILNIELDDKVGKLATIDERFSAVIMRVRTFFSRTTGECRSTSYPGPDGNQVDTCVAVLTVDFHTDKNLFEMAMRTICKDFDQDCVAVFYSDGEGKLVGPKADEWGEFNLAHFTKPSIYELMAA